MIGDGRVVDQDRPLRACLTLLSETLPERIRAVSLGVVEQVVRYCHLSWLPPEQVPGNEQ
jgi:hypothetical protein